MHGNLLDHVPHDYRAEEVPLIACVHFSVYVHNIMHEYVSASGLQVIFLWYSTIHYRTRGLLSNMPVKVVIMTL